MLVLSQEPETLDRVTSTLAQRADHQQTCMSSAAFARNPFDADLFDLVVLDADGAEDISSLLRVFATARPGLICLCSRHELAGLVQVARGIDCEFLPKPVSSSELFDVAEEVLRERELALLLSTKYKNMRRLVRRVVRERRDLNRRVELVCRDLVEAHRRLTYRFVELQKAQSSHN